MDGLWLQETCCFARPGCSLVWLSRYRIARSTRV